MLLRSLNVVVEPVTGFPQMRRGGLKKGFTAPRPLGSAGGSAQAKGSSTLRGTLGVTKRKVSLLSTSKPIGHTTKLLGSRSPSTSLLSPVGRADATSADRGRPSVPTPQHTPTSGVDESTSVSGSTSAASTDIRTPAAPSKLSVGLGVRRPALSGGLLGKRKSFQAPKRSVTPSMAAKKAAEAAMETKVYKVVYTKHSQKKHKIWADGFVVLNGKTATLKDSNGKQVALERTSFKSLGINESLAVRYYDTEVMSEVPVSDYTSGRIFISTASAPDQKPLSTVNSRSSLMKSSKHTKKRFAVPRGPGSEVSEETAAAQPPLVPMFDPTSPGAVVLEPAPDAEDAHRRRAVVVDPHLGHTLRPHQKAGVRFMYDCVMGRRGFDGFGCILADEMGLGKTLQTIALLWTLLKQSPTKAKSTVTRAVVVTPSSLVENWKQEFAKWLTRTRLTPMAVVKQGKAAEAAVKDWANSNKFRVLIISYEMYRKYASIINGKSAQVGLMVCDEGHRLKSSGGNKTIAALRACPARRRVLLTGTPIQNDLMEFFALADFVNPNVLGAADVFRRIYQEPIDKLRDKRSTQEELAIGRERAAHLSQLSSQFILRRTSELLDKYLPPKTETVVFCRMAETQLRLYKRLLTLAKARAASEQAASLQLITLLKKTCNHPELLYKHALCDRDGGIDASDDDDADSPLDESFLGQVATACEPLFAKGFAPGGTDMALASKFQVLEALLVRLRDETDDRVVLVSNTTQTLDIMGRMCDGHGWRFVRLDGSTTIDKRQGLVDQYNREGSDVFVFMLSARAGGAGFNLVGGNRLIMFDPDWNPAIDKQAMARVWRDGQKKHTYIYRFLATGSLEEKMYQRQSLKESVAGSVMGSGTTGKRNPNFAREDLRELFKFDEDDLESCGTHRLVQQASGATGVTSDGRRLKRKIGAGVTAEWAAAHEAEWKYRGPEDIVDVHLRAVVETAGDIVSFVSSKQLNTGAATTEEAARAPAPEAGAAGSTAAPTSTPFEDPVEVATSNAGIDIAAELCKEKELESSDDDCEPDAKRSRSTKGARSGSARARRRTSVQYALVSSDSESDASAAAGAGAAM